MEHNTLNTIVGFFFLVLASLSATRAQNAEYAHKLSVAKRENIWTLIYSLVGLFFIVIAIF